MKATFTWSEATGETKATFTLEGDTISIMDFLQDVMAEATAKYNEQGVKLLGWEIPELPK